MPDQHLPWVSLGSGELTAEVNPLGAQLSSLRDRDGRDLLWDGDPAVWAGRAPLLFPIVGALAGGAYRVNSATYHLPRHGLARGRLFTVVESSPAAVMFRLEADAASLQIYPFRFALDVNFSLQGTSLTVTALVRNEGDIAMPASFGYHPAFRWPLPFGQARSAHFVQFADDEPDPVRRLNAEGLLTPERHPTPVAQRRLVLGDALFQDDVVIFDKIRSRSVTFGAAVGPKIRVSYPNAPYLGLWSKLGGNFICIEPWHGVADPQGFAADFTTKPGVFILAPGERRTIEMEVSLLAS